MNNTVDDLGRALKPIINRAAKSECLHYIRVTTQGLLDMKSLRITASCNAPNPDYAYRDAAERNAMEVIGTAVAKWCAKRGSLVRMSTEGNRITVTLVD
jgi:hypothetical protein